MQFNQHWIELFVFLAQNNDYIQSVARCLQMMLRVDEYRFAFLTVDGISTLLSILASRVNFQVYNVYNRWCGYISIFFSLLILVLTHFWDQLVYERSDSQKGDTFHALFFWNLIAILHLISCWYCGLQFRAILEYIFYDNLLEFNKIKLSGPIPTGVLPVGPDIQPFAGGEDEQVQRDPDPRGYPQRLCEGKSHAYCARCLPEPHREAWRPAGTICSILIVRSRNNDVQGCCCHISMPCLKWRSVLLKLSLSIW